ncbi:MAG: hypothetical protein WBB31_00680, partial [Saprospiraceae bacterium]
AKGTKLTFTQTDVPASTYDSLSKGWKDYYWEPIQLAIGNWQLAIGKKQKAKSKELSAKYFDLLH